ncbi:hypothetical protein [uncultured Citrobacter sp.]|uniref:hypothetical protein n=1 Tax=uncultured Citrobacter sp. TaxID=200446 RepID=UPI0025994F11|nr:hypothetical protein [uncultured Citrobacter sp.]
MGRGSFSGMRRGIDASGITLLPIDRWQIDRRLCDASGITILPIDWYWIDRELRDVSNIKAYLFVVMSTQKAFIGAFCVDITKPLQAFLLKQSSGSSAIYSSF